MAFITKDEMTIFFKTKFWRKVKILHYNDEIFWKEKLFWTSLWPAGIIGHFEDKICETLDLMT